MTSEAGEGLSCDRIRGPPGVNVDHLECPICRNVLWQPVACQTCETPYCAACMAKWHLSQPAKCPNLCAPFIERKCPPFVVRMLSQLEISCVYQSQGCNISTPYEALEKHQAQCGYQPQQCSGCRVEGLKKDMADHEATCLLIDLTCSDCQSTYKRGDAATRHIENTCLKEQLRQLRNEFRESRFELHKVTEQLEEMRKLQAQTHKYITITALNLSNVTSRRGAVSESCKGIKWSGFEYMNSSYAQTKYANSGYTTACMASDSSYIVFSLCRASISVESPDEPFSVLALTACAAWNDNLQLIIKGFRGRTEVKMHNSTLLYGKPQEIILGWSDIDTLTLESSGGSAHSANSIEGKQFILTCFRFVH